MPAPREVFKLPRRMGRLIRTSRQSAWIWQRWQRRLGKWVATPTHEVNRSRAEQFAYQQFALGGSQTPLTTRSRILFSTIAGDYVAARKEGRTCRKLRPSSLLKLRGAIAAFKTFFGAGHDTLCIDHVDSAVLKEFVEGEAARVRPPAANRNLKFITQILEFAFARNLLSEVPKTVSACNVPTEAEENDDGINGSPVPTAQEVRTIIEAAHVNQTPTGNRTRHGRPIYSGLNANDYSQLFAALCLTGMRIGEACHLTWHDVDFDNKVILVRPGQKGGKYWQPKTKYGIRRIAIVPELESILQRLRTTNRKGIWVFETKRGTQVYAHNVAKRFRRICKNCGFKKHFVVHSLRKYWASTVAQQGMAWQVMIKMFGHSDFKLILSTYYAQNDDARLVEEAMKIDYGLRIVGTMAQE